MKGKRVTDSGIVLDIWVMTTEQLSACLFKLRSKEKDKETISKIKEIERALSKKALTLKEKLKIPKWLGF